MLSVMAELVPLHTGEVHLAEFTENFNYYSRFSVYPDGEVLNQLDAQGNWEKVPRPEGEAVAYVNLNGNAEDQFPGTVSVYAGRRQGNRSFLYRRRGRAFVYRVESG